MLTPDDDNERSECKRARMEGVAGCEGNSGVGVGMGVAGTGTGGNEMDMTNDSEEDPPHAGVAYWCSMLASAE